MEILRTYISLLCRFKPLDWRVQWFFRCYPFLPLLFGMAEIEERMPHFDPAKHTTEDVVRQGLGRRFFVGQGSQPGVTWGLRQVYISFVLYVIFLYLYILFLWLVHYSCLWQLACTFDLLFWYISRSIFLDQLVWCFDCIIWNDWRFLESRIGALLVGGVSSLSGG